MTPAKLAQLKVRPAPRRRPPPGWTRWRPTPGSGHVRRLLDLRGSWRRRRERRCAPSPAPAERWPTPGRRWISRCWSPRAGWRAPPARARRAAADFRARRAHRAGGRRPGRRACAPAAQAASPRAGRRPSALLEFEVEIRALEKIMDQGARWLQDMRNQLKTRQAAGRRRRRAGADPGRTRAAASCWWSA